MSTEGIPRRGQWPETTLQAEKAMFQNKWLKLLYRGAP